MELGWWKTTGAIGVELKEVTEEDAQQGLIDICHHVVGGDAERVCFTTERKYDQGNEWVAEAGVRSFRRIQILGPLLPAGPLPPRHLRFEECGQAAQGVPEAGGPPHQGVTCTGQRV